MDKEFIRGHLFFFFGAACGTATVVMGLALWEPGQPEQALLTLLLGHFILFFNNRGYLRWRQERCKEEQRAKLRAMLLDQCQETNSPSPLQVPSYRALVLCGGGGKGAYQVGSISAFRDHGLNFDLLCGASAGALNAAIVTRSGVDTAVRLWAMPRTEILSITLVGLIVAFLRFISNIASHFSIPVANPGRTIAAHGLIVVSVTLIMSDLLVSEQFWEFLIAQFYILLVIPLQFGAVLWLLLEYYNVSMFENSRLRNMLNIAITGTILPNSNVAVVVSRRVDCVLSGQSTKRSVKTLFVPEYIRIQLLSAVTVRTVLIASAAIPMGVLKRIRFRRNWYIDGGVTDNCPILPAVEDGATEIFIVHTNSHGIANGECVLNSDGLLMHLLRTKALRDIGHQVGDDSARRVPISGPWTTGRITSVDMEAARKFAMQLRETRIVHVIPSVQLGSLITSLFRLSAGRALFLRDLGYQDAVKAINSRD